MPILNLPNKRQLIEFPFYPVLMSAFLPMKLLAPNLAVFDVSQAMRAVAVMAIIGLMLASLCLLVLRNIHFAGLLSGLAIGTVWVIMANPAYGLPFFLFTSVVIFLLWRNNIGFRGTRVLNVFAMAIFLQPLIAIAADYIWMQKAFVDQMAYSPFNQTHFNADSVVSRPNIVHITLDGYADSDVLRNEFGFDNSHFTDALRERGFVVASDTRTPYNQTLLVMASVFGGNYLDPHNYPLIEENPDKLRMTLGRSVSEGPLKRRLSELGYSFLSTDSGYYFFRPAPGEILSSPEFGSLSMNFFEEEFTARVLNLFPDTFTKPLDLKHIQAARFNTYLRHALNTDFHKNQPSPFHYFVHMLAPHPPFVIDRNGNKTEKWMDNFNTLRDASDATSMDPEKQLAYRDGYLEKLRYINSALIPHIDKLIAEIPSPMVIILHGDHGSGATFHQDDKAAGCLKDRFTPLLAVYSDNPNITAAFSNLDTERFNLVNLYRVLADASFGTTLGQLEDKSWFARWEDPQHPELLADTDIQNNCPAHKQVAAR